MYVLSSRVAPPLTRLPPPCQTKGQGHGDEWDIPIAVASDVIEALGAAIDKPFSLPDGAFFIDCHQAAMKAIPPYFTEYVGGHLRVATDLGICTMCEGAPATTRWGFPVCQPCFDGLVETQSMLEQMEAEDPVLAEQGRRVEESFARFLAVQQEATDG